jgi:glutamate--cysteine ligase
MSLDRRSAETPPVRGVGDLISWFRARERPPSEWKVGLEHEKVPVVSGTTRPVPYGGPRGIAAFLRGFCRFGYEPFEDAGNIIAAQREGLTVSIEPGGQIELSGRPFQDVHVVADEIDRHHAKCSELGAELGIALLATGYRPWGTPASAEWVPKTRYGVMRPYLAAHGRYGEDMMAMTGSTQASFDFGSEQDVAEKLRMSLAVQPVCAALWANSPIVDGRESGWLSYRVQVWESVDPARQGLLPFAFQPGFVEDPYRHYVEWALDVPMIFVRRDGGYRDPGGLTFRAFMSDGLDGERATLLDWEDHLSTVFTEVRVKGVVEVRAADACDAGMTKALAAFWKGLLYDRASRAAAFELVRDLTLQQRRDLMIAAGREALRARVPDGRTLAALARELIEISSAGLCRQNCCGKKGQDERVWLEPLAARAEAARAPADEALEAFRRGGDAALLAHYRIA